MLEYGKRKIHLKIKEKELKVVDIFPLVEQMKLSIESLTLWGNDKLLVGTTEGTLMVFNLIYDPQNSKPKFY